ncbi:MAG: hypothetical protein ACI31M_01440 [Bacilli bacterium]
MDKKKVINNIILIFLGGLFLLFGFGKQSLNYYRIVLVGIGFIISLIGFIRLFKNKIKNIPLLIIIGALGMLFIDTVIAINFSRIPVFSYNIITNNNSRVYNAIGYRIWSCEGKPYKVDKLYKLGYYCDVNDMEEMNSNAFLGEIVDNFDDYKNRYIKISGKISRKESINYIEMQAYQPNGISLNGYVNFSDNVTLRVVFKNGASELSSYDIYDNITVVGKIWYLRENNGNYVVYMDDSKIVNEMNFDNFEIITNDQNSCEMDQKLLYEAADYSLYSTCLDSVIFKFDEKNIYEISSVLSSGKISINKILDRANNKIKEDTTGTEMYIFDKFNIIKCSESTGSAIIIGNSDLTLQDAYCGIDMGNNAGV